MVKILPFLIGGALISGGVATAVVISQRNTENSELERSDSSSPNAKGQKTQDDKHQETIPSVLEKQDLSLGTASDQSLQSETHTQDAEVRNSDRSLVLEVADSHSENLESSAVERRGQPEPSAS